MKQIIVNLIATLLVVLVNALANILPINGQTTGEISNKLDVLFTPAGYVFGIWGLIYLLLLIWTIRQIPSSRRNLPVYKKAAPLYVLSSALNIAWILLWHFEFFLLTVFVMIGLLLTLIRIYHVIKNENSILWDLLPFSVYLGWISVATIANISYYLKHIGWDGFRLSDMAWSIIMLLVATLLALYFTYKNKDTIYPFVFVWAFIGIGVKNYASHSVVSITSYVLSAIILFGVFLSLNRKQ